MVESTSPIGAVILGAGRSSRMGAPKLTLPWGNTTVIGRIIEVLEKADVEPIVLVTGGAREDVEKVLANKHVVLAYNAAFEHTEMLESLRIGLQSIPETLWACLVVLGDQPQIEVETVSRIMKEYREKQHFIIAPSYQMRRGHPWLVDRRLFYELTHDKRIKTLREFLNSHSQEICYVEVMNDSVLKDIDTPEDYRNQRPNHVRD